MPFFPQFSNLFVAPYVPTPPAEQILWLKADAGVTTSGSTVTAWADQSGKGNDAVPYNNPQFASNQINGKPVIVFDGTGARFVAPLVLPSTQSRSIFLVGKYNDTAGGQQGFLNLADGGVGDKGYLFKSNGQDDSYFYNAGGQIQFPTEISVSNYCIFFVNSQTSGSVEIALNDLFASGSIPTYTADRVIIGSRYDNDSEPADCNIAEIIIYSGTLTEEQKYNIIGDLNAKYAIY